jgi:hypothetical protein
MRAQRFGQRSDASANFRDDARFAQQSLGELGVPPVRRKHQSALV